MYSLGNTETYVGATNNVEDRLSKHNSGKGARRTKGRSWLPILYVSGFGSRREALSFEKGWQKLYKKRTKERLDPINTMSNNQLSYIPRATRWNRIIDLLFFVHNVSLLGTKFKLNYDLRHPIFLPRLTINVFLEPFIKKLPWPFFVKVKYIRKVKFIR